MSKKISSTSKYLGISRDWFVNFQFYGKFYLNFFFFLNFYKLLNLLFRKILNNKLFISNITVYFLLELIELNIGITFFQKNNNVNLIKLQYNSINLFLLNNLFKINFKIYLNKLSWFSKLFIEMYIEYLVLIYNPKKIFNLLVILLKNQLNKVNILYLNSGLKKIQLKGFKIQLKGRYELSKSTLARKSFFKFGQVTSNNLNSLLYSSYKDIYSKLGKSTIKIWYFYL